MWGRGKLRPGIINMEVTGKRYFAALCREYLSKTGQEKIQRGIDNGKAAINVTD